MLGKIGSIGQPSKPPLDIAVGTLTSAVSIDHSISWVVYQMGLRIFRMNANLRYG